MEVFVHIKGFLKDPTAYPEFQGREFLSHKFTAKGQNPEAIANFVNSAMMEILAAMQAMIVPKDENESCQGLEGFNNLRVWPLACFKYFEIETKTLTSITPTPDTKGVEKVTVN